MWLKLGLALALVVTIAVLGIAGFLGRSMTRAERVPVEENPARFGLEYQNVSFPSRVDGLRLHGWYLPVNDGERVVIMVHGADQHRADPGIGMLDIASGLAEQGYAVLIFLANWQNGGKHFIIKVWQKFRSFPMRNVYLRVWDSFRNRWRSRPLL